MARPLRIEFPGAVYHVTSRGDRQEPIFEDDDDRLALLNVVAQALSRFDGQMLAYCLMGNHYHFVLHTRKANLSKLMRHINGVYTQAFNRRHVKVGHLFQGRFKAILVDSDAYLLEVCRYVELNPVRAGTTRKPDTWRWSSYRAHAGLEPAPQWLDTAELHGYVLGRPARTASERRRAGQAYARLVASAKNVRLWDGALQKQIYLGDEDFVERMQALADPQNSTDPDIPKIQRSKARTLRYWLTACQSREEALYRAHTESGISMTQLANEIGLSVSRVSRLIKQAENDLAKGKA
ncbi:MAG: transposase [Betaproteobacteria bacterium]|nr:MAG: transposase [Betaproteobacteria bacterium]